MAKFITSLCLSDNRLGKLFVKRFIKCQSIQYTNTFKGSNNITHSGFTHWFNHKTIIFTSKIVRPLSKSLKNIIEMKCKELHIFIHTSTVSVATLLIDINKKKQWPRSMDNK